MVYSWVVRRYLKRRKAITFLLVMTVGALVVVAALTSTVAVQMERALDNSVRFSQGGYSYVLDPPADVSESVLTQAGYSPVRESLVTLKSNGPLIPLREMVDSAAPGILIEGEYPKHAGEALVSRSLRGEVDSSGELTYLTNQGAVTVTVSGIAVDSMAPTADRIVRRVDELSSVGDLLWVGNEDPRSISKLDSVVDRIRTSTIPESFGDNNVNPVKETLAPLLAAKWWLTFAGSCIAIIVLSVLRTRSAGEVNSLMAAGATHSVAWRILHASWGIGLFAGLVAGALASLLIFNFGKSAFGEYFGQYWDAQLAEPLAGLWVVVLPLFLGIVLLPLAHSYVLAVKRSRVAIPSFVSKRSGLPLASLTLGAVGLFVITIPLATGNAPPLSATWAPAFGILLSFGLPFAWRMWAFRQLAPVSRRVLDTVTASMQKVAFIVAPLLFVATTWSVMADRIATDNQTENEAGIALQLVGVPDWQEDQILKYFGADGSTAGKSYSMIDSGITHEPLAIGSETQKCIANAQDWNESNNCFFEDFPTSVVLNTSQPNSILAPSHFNNQKALALAWPMDDGRITAETYDDSQLVVPSEDAESASVVLVGPQTEMGKRISPLIGSRKFLVLPGYFAKSADRQAELRSYLYASAPTSFLQTSIPASEPIVRAAARSVGAISAMIASMIILLVAASQNRAFSDVRSIVFALGNRKVNRPYVTANVTMVLAVTCLVPAIAALCAWCALPHNGAGIGTSWLAWPVMVAICAGIFQAGSAVADVRFRR